MKKAVVTAMVLWCGVVAVQAANINLGTWANDKNYQVFMAEEANGGTPVSDNYRSVFYSDHIYLPANSPDDTWAGIFQYTFKADTAIIDKVTFDIDQYNWNPEASGNVTSLRVYVNDNGWQLASYTELPLGSTHTGSISPVTYTFSNPTDTVTIEIRKRHPWDGYPYGQLDLYERSAGNTPWVFHSTITPEPVSLALVGMGMMFIRRRNGR